MGTLPPVDRQNDGWTDACQNITFPRTTYAGGKYIDLDNPTVKIDFVEPYPTATLADDTFLLIQKKYLELAVVYLGAQVKKLPIRPEQNVFFLKDLQNYRYREAATRVFVDALITPILLRHGMQVRLAEELYKAEDKKKTLPNSIADYVIYSKTGKILGTIETKRGGALIGQSVIQCMLQLLASRRKAPHTLFGVVTDGARYVFIVLTQDGTFEFESDTIGQVGDTDGQDGDTDGQDGDTDGQDGCQGRSYDINTWEDLRQILGVLNFLLQRGER